MKKYTNIKTKGKRGKVSNYLFLLILFLSFITTVKGQTDTSFWFVAPKISSNNGANSNEPIVLRFASMGKACSITISEPANPSFIPIINLLAANSSLSVDLTSRLSMVENQPPDAILNYGIHVQSTDSITAYYDEWSNSNPEIYTLKGGNALGTSFYISGQNLYYNVSNMNAYCTFEIVATEDNTTVTIIPSQDITGHSAGVFFTKKLNKGQTYSARGVSELATLHLEGSYVTSDKPIAITIFDDSVYDGMCADAIGDQTIPINMTGTEYIVVRGNLTSADNVFITATQNNTSIYINGNATPVATINAGATYEYNVSSTSYIQTTNPVYVYQLTGEGCELGSAILPSIECTGSTEVSFTRSLGGLFDLMLIVKTGGEGSFYLNGNATYVPFSAFTVVPGTGGVWKAAKISMTTTQVPVGTASIITNTNKFGMGMLLSSSTGSDGAAYGYFSNFNPFTASVSSDKSSICVGQNVQMNAIGGTTYVWKPDTTLSALNIPNPIATPVKTTTYTVTISNSSGCMVTDSVTITVDTLPVANASGNSVCSGQSLKLFSNGGTSYSWSGPGGYTSSEQNPVITDAPVSSTGTYTVTVSSTGCIQTASATVTVTVKPLPSVTINPNPVTICSGESETLTVNSGNTYLWSPSAGLNKTTGDTVTANPTYTTTYTVTATLNGCTNTANVPVTVNPIPPVTINPNPATICSGNSVTLTASNANTYLWSPSAGLNTTTGETVTANPTYTTIYTVTGTLNGCTKTTNVTVTVNPLPTITVKPNPTTICSGNSVTLTASGASTYSWSPSAGLNTTTGNSVIANPTIIATTYTVTGIDAKGCINSGTAIVNKDTMHVRLRDTTICFGSPLILNAGNPDSSYIWNTGATTQSIAVSKQGTYSVTVTDIYGCISSDSAKIFVNPPLKLNLGKNRTIDEDTTIILHAGSGYKTYRWQDGTIDSTYTVNHKGTYWVSATDKNGCKYSDTVVIDVTCYSKGVFIPNVFTPGNSSICDAWFRIEGRCIGKTEVTIFNRWGDKIYWNDYDFSTFMDKTSCHDVSHNNLVGIYNSIYYYKLWDGTDKRNGGRVAEGTYFYILTYNITDDNSTNKITKKGSITVLK